MLADDFNMYYSGTYVGLKTDEGLVPFYVESVYNDDSILDFDNMSRSERRDMEFSVEAENALVFTGYRITSDGRQHSTQVPMTSENLVLDPPDSHYTVYNNNPYWITYSSCRSTKKGINDRKLRGYPTFSHRFMYAFYQPQTDDRIINEVFFKRDNGDIDYKGAKIGTKDGETITIFSEAKYLIPYLNEGFPECQVIIED
ncbi:hypothetical protein CPT_Privateer_091 [Proteus phage Privateer]|uniref:Uncharacterized protein n=1 Tax=Proteus phage Privateer TaxID=2712958 RepID=A0A6G8R3X4_9CAUD|nr:hypothetical protein HWD17_gp091 [Proteus phage Privateer]QIN94884.1 hypothetical protein CPT_Privateer_091 [Proteus phage Privateer]